MGKRIITMMLAVVLVFTFVACGQKNEPAKKEQSVFADRYTMDLALNTEGHTLSGAVTMTVRNETGGDLDKVCLRNYAAAMSKSQIIKAATGDGKALSVKEEKDKSVVYIDLDQKLKQGESTKVVVNFETTVPEKRNRFGYYEKEGNSIYQLSFCLPQLAMYEDGTWNENPYVEQGETSYSRCTDYDVTLKAPKEYTVVASGDEETKDTTTRITAKQVRDVAIVASNFMKSETVEIKGTKINSYYLTDNKEKVYQEFALAAAKDAFERFSDYYGEYPYKELDVVQTKSDSDMEYPGLVMVGTAFDQGEGQETSLMATQVCSTVAHEVAHQWFYAAVGNDQYGEPWLDEGLAQFSQSILYEDSDAPSIVKAVERDQSKGLPVMIAKHSPQLLEGYDSYEDYMEKYIEQIVGKKLIISKPYPYYDGESGMAYIEVYDGGKLFFYELKQQMGEADFQKAMKEYYETYKLKETHGKDLIEILKKHGAEDKIIDKYIEL